MSQQPELPAMPPPRRGAPIPNLRLLDLLKLTVESMPSQLKVGIGDDAHHNWIIANFMYGLVRMPTEDEIRDARQRNAEVDVPWDDIYVTTDGLHADEFDYEPIQMATWVVAARKAFPALVLEILWLREMVGKAVVKGDRDAINALSRHEGVIEPEFWQQFSSVLKERRGRLD